MPDYKTVERYFCKNARGHDLFYLDIVLIKKSVPVIALELSLRRPISSIPFSMLIDQIKHEFIDESRRTSLVALLFMQIKSIPGIFNDYFSEDYLKWDGTYSECNYNTIQYLLKEKDFNDYSVFSTRINSLFFQEAKFYLQINDVIKNKVEVCREHFEELVGNNETLQDEYTEQFNVQAEFFIVVQESQGEVYEFYVMVIMNEIKLFFIRRSL